MAYLERYYLKIPEHERSTAAIAFFAAIDHIATVAPSVAVSILKELRDQTSSLKLIASENFSSLAVQLAMGNLLTDKYAEGYPFHRFYAGCDNVDAIEAEAALESQLLFGADHAYVQPHSGADANLIALWAILTQHVQLPTLERLSKKTIDELTVEEHESLRLSMLSQKLMGMALGSGGHLTHGYSHNISSKLMQATSYHVDPVTGLLDYAAIAKQAQQVKPLILLAGYSSYPRRIDFAKMREIADSVGAVLWVDMAHFAGLVAGKVFVGDFNPIPFAHLVTSTTHKTLRGPRGGFILCKNEYKDLVNKGCPMVMGGPLPHVLAAKAVAFKEASRPQFQKYAQAIVDNAQTLAQALIKRGARLLTGGTDNHLLVMDVRPYGINGRQAETALRQALLTANRNSIPSDPNGSWYTSGIRIGTAACTTLGMGAQEMEQIAHLIIDVLTRAKPASLEKGGQVNLAKVIVEPQALERTQAGVKELLFQFPLYPELDLEGIRTAHVGV